MKVREFQATVFTTHGTSVLQEVRLTKKNKLAKTRKKFVDGLRIKVSIFSSHS